MTDNPLRTARERLGWSQRELARRANVPHQIVNELESSRHPREHFIDRIVATLNAALPAS